MTDDKEYYNRKYIYVLRLGEQGIPNFDYKEDAEAEMCSYFVMGSCNGKQLQGLLQHMVDVRNL